MTKALKVGALIVLLAVYALVAYLCYLVFTIRWDPPG